MSKGRYPYDYTNGQRLQYNGFEVNPSRPMTQIEVNDALCEIGMTDKRVESAPAEIYDEITCPRCNNRLFKDPEYKADVREVFSGGVRERFADQGTASYTCAKCNHKVTVRIILKGGLANEDC